ncbi:MAG: nicotinamide-nucleotide adenylyltransferase [Promethearchaeota archaeon]
MNNEILVCIEKNNKKFLQSGQISKYVFPMKRIEAHEKKVSHLITRFFILSISLDGSPLYLVQKRGKSKKTFPGYFTDSSSGHVNWEKYLDLNKIKNNALRELEEEFGIPPREVKKVQLYDLNSEGDEIAYIFLGFVKYDVPLNPDEEELDFKFSRFYNKAELEKILETEKYIDYSKQIWEKLLNKDISSIFEKKNVNNTKNTYRVALFLGRFQPLHHGHIYVIKQILKFNKKIKIGIGSSQISNTLNDPFTSDERKKFIITALERRSISSKSYELFDIPDIFNAKKWVDHVISIVGKFDIVYSNSDWVRELFSNKGIKVGNKISIFKKKFNGNNVRNLIIKNKKEWKSLVPNEVVELIGEYNGVSRLKTLYEKERKS